MGSALPNSAIVLRRRPQGAPQPDDFEAISLPRPEPGPGQLLVRAQALSLDPYMAPALHGRHLSGAVAVGDVMPGEVVGVVEVSCHPAFATGDPVITRGGWRRWCLADGEAPASSGPTSLAAQLAPVARPIAPLPGLPLSLHLGVLGMPGLTAHALLQSVLRPQPGDAVAVFAAAGAVGSVLGPLLRRAGARPLAVVGTAAKAQALLADARSGYEAALLRNAPLEERAAQLRALCPQGLQALVANDAGPALAPWLDALALGGRVALIGNMTQYNAADPQPGAAWGPVIARRATVTGFVVYDHHGLLPEWQALASRGLQDGWLPWHEDRVQGLAAAPAAFARLMRGQTRGKVVVDLGE